MSGVSSNDKWRRFATRVDHYLIPIVGGCFSLLILVQLVAAVPSVRSALDNFEGRFVQAAAAMPANHIQNQSATVTLYLSPAESRPDVAVLVNGTAIMNFTEPQILIHVKSGDVISIKSRDGKAAVVTIDHNNPNLLTPAPGQVVSLTSGQMYGDFTPVRFGE